MNVCHACRKELSVGREIGRRDECPFCHADLRCCLNCRFFDRSAPKQCREPQADLVRDKDKANFCGFFGFQEKESAVPFPAGTDADKNRQALEDLFKK